MPRSSDGTESNRLVTLVLLAWAEREFSKAEVNRAGATLIDDTASDSDVDHALTVLNNWRSSHSFPLNTFQVWLRKHAAQVDSSSLVVQRLKRVPSIVAKLRRQGNMKLARMHDIGGCRAVVSSIPQVHALIDHYQRSRIRHEQKRMYDYISNPKTSGYRGVHLGTDMRAIAAPPTTAC